MIKAVVLETDGSEREIRIGRRYGIAEMNIYRGYKWCEVLSFVEGKKLAAMVKFNTGHVAMIALGALEPLSALEQLADEGRS